MRVLDIAQLRKQFEEDYAAAQMPAESDWFRLDADGDYRYRETESAWEGYQLAAKRATHPAPSVPAQACTAERTTLETAADYLDLYAKLLYDVKSTDIEAHPYVPSIQEVAEELRATAASKSVGTVSGGDGDPAAYLIRDKREHATFLGQHEWKPCSIKDYELRKEHSDIFEFIPLFHAIAAAGQRGEDAKLAPNWAGEFRSFADWVNRAQRALKSPSHAQAVCIDAKGRRCAIGADFMRARDDDSFPIRYFWDCAAIAAKEGKP